VRAVDAVSFDVGTGETVGIVGESGSGKSITALSLMGLVPTGGRTVSGSIRLQGAELTELPPSGLAEIRRKKMAMVFQEPGSCLNPVLPIGRQIAEACGWRGRLDKTMRAKVLSALRDVKIANPERVIDSYPHELSGGMQQRVVIAAAIIREPLLIIADEPTTALDATVQSEILALLKELREARSMALVMISHDLAVIAQTCDRVLVMYGGQIVEQGPARRIFAAPRHPYTQALMQSIVDPWIPDGALKPLAGLPPDLANPPSGCRFHPRCSRRMAECVTIPPPEVLVDPDHMSRCLLDAKVTL
jgi:oligopeptide/dipeptide ABC transporter ATP-binding protein